MNEIIEPIKVNMPSEFALKLCAIMEGLLPEGAEMTDEIRAEAAKRLDAAGIVRTKKDAD